MQRATQSNTELLRKSTSKEELIEGAFESAKLFTDTVKNMILMTEVVP